IDIAAGGDTVTIDRYGHVGDAVQRVAARLVALFHPRGHGVDAVPDADVAVVGHALVGEARPEQGPVALVDARRVPHEHVGDLLPDVEGRLRHDVAAASSSRPMTPPPAS